MPRSPIPGFLKKRTATRKFNRSTRQIARDIAIAIDMRDESVLDNIAIRTEEGNVINGTEVTSDLIKKLRNDGLNPTWYFRKTWLKETYGFRTNSVHQTDDQVEADSESESHDPMPNSETGMIALMQESIRELKKDKELLTEQLRIKDTQLQESTSRWKETNYISQTLNKRLEAMEEQLKLVGSTAPLRTPADSDRTFVDATPKETETSAPEVAREETPSKLNTTSHRTAKKPKVRRAKKSTAQAKKKAPGQNAQRKRPAQSPTPDHKWYDMPTFRRFLSRKK